MKLLFLHAPLPRISFSVYGLSSEPLTAVYHATALASAHEIRLIDMRLRPKLARQLHDFKPDVAFVGVLPTTYITLDKILPELRRLVPGIKIVLLGEAEYGVDHLLERPLDFAHDEADILIRNITIASQQQLIPQLLEALGSRREIQHVPALFVKQMDGSWLPTQQAPDEIADIGVPDRRVLGRFRGRYSFAAIRNTAFLFNSFGCRHRCRFCPMSKYGNTIWIRRRADVLEELSQMSEANVFISDYEPLQEPEALAELGDAIEARGLQRNFFLMTRTDSALKQLPLLERWKRIGLKWVFMGLDGHSDARLKEERKGTTRECNEEALRAVQETGIGVMCNFVIRSDFSKADFAGLRNYVRRLKPRMFGFTVETPLVGTTLFDETEHLLTSRDWSLFDLGHAVLPTKLALPTFYHELTRLYVLASRMSFPAVAMHFPIRDFMRNALTGPIAIARTWFSARDHRERKPA